jgi:hypothetical protein
MARTKQTARKNIGGPKALPRKSNAGKKASTKAVFVNEVSTSSSNEDVMVITENLDKMKLPELRKILKEYNISESDIQGSGKGGNVLKSDIILAIKDRSSQEHDGKSMTLKSKKKSPPKKKVAAKKSPKKSPAKKKKVSPKKSPPKKKKASPEKVLTIVSSPKGMKVSSVDKLTAVQALEALKTYKQFQGLSDYEVKKKLGVTKVADIRQALRTLMDNPKSPIVALKKVSPKKSPPKKKKASPKKSPLKKKKVSPKKSPLKKKKEKTSLKCADKEYDRSTQFCNTKTGKIGKLTKKGRPHGEEGIKGNIGATYTFNEKYGFVGSEEDVKAHIDHIKKVKNVKEPKKSPPKEKTPPKKSPPKKTSKKKSPPKKSPPKKTKTTKTTKAQKPGTPVKPKTPVKIKRACAAGDMESFDGYDRCDIGEVCNAMTGKCIDDTEQNRTGLSSLMVDGRDIIGDRDTIVKLHKHLGGKISVYKESKEATPKKSTPVRTIKSTKEAKEKKKATPRKSPAKSPKKSPAKPSAKETKKSDGTMVTASREDIYRTFTECLASLK